MQLIMQTKKFIHSFQLFIFMSAMSVTAIPLSACEAHNEASLASDYEQLALLLSSSSYFQAHFQQTVRDANGDIIDQSTGKIRLARPHQLRWDIIEPFERGSQRHHRWYSRQHW